MVTRYNRRGHERRNANGTVSWVSPHEVVKEYVLVRDLNGQLLVNGEARLRETKCSYCHNKVFHAALKPSKNVYFNNNVIPLIRHVCLKPQDRGIERDGALRKAKPFYSPAEIAAQEARSNIENIDSDKKSNKLSERQILLIYNKLETSTAKIRALKVEIGKIRSSKRNKKTKEVKLFELRGQLIFHELEKLKLQKPFYRDSKKLPLMEAKIIKKEKALEEFSKAEKNRRRSFR